jgi:hypothetical protein
MEKHQVIKHVLKTCASNAGAKKKHEQTSYFKRIKT